MAAVGRRIPTMRIETLAAHAGAELDPVTGAVAPPIHLSTTFEHGPANEDLHGFIYVRDENPTQDRLEDAHGLRERTPRGASMTPRAWLLFALSSVIWGVPYLFIKVAVNADIPPAFIAWSRVAFGAVLVLPLAWWQGALPGLRSRGWPIAAYAACEIAVPFILIAIGERHLSSSLTAILIASMPLMVALLSARFSPADKPTGLRM